MRWRTSVGGVNGGEDGSRNDRVVVEVDNPGSKFVDVFLFLPERALVVHVRGRRDRRSRSGRTREAERGEGGEGEKAKLDEPSRNSSTPLVREARKSRVSRNCASETRGENLPAHTSQAP